VVLLSYLKIFRKEKTVLTVIGIVVRTVNEVRIKLTTLKILNGKFKQLENGEKRTLTGILNITKNTGKELKKLNV
jgi:hypothetical protein